MKKCKSGYYYCNTDKKCKPIPRGYRVGYGGYLRKEKDDDDSKNKSNGNGNGNGNGSHGNGNGGNGSGGNGNGGMGESVTHESVAAIPAIAGASKVIPAVVAGVGALGTIMQASKKGDDIKSKRGTFGTNLRGRPRISSKKDESKTADIAKEKGLDLTDPRQRRKAASLVNRNQMKNRVNNPDGIKNTKNEEVISFKQFQEKLTHIGVTLKKVEKEIKSQPGDKPYIQEPGKPPKKI